MNTVLGRYRWSTYSLSVSLKASLPRNSGRRWRYSRALESQRGEWAIRGAGLERERERERELAPAAHIKHSLLGWTEWVAWPCIVQWSGLIEWRAPIDVGVEGGT